MSQIIGLCPYNNCDSIVITRLDMATDDEQAYMVTSFPCHGCSRPVYLIHHSRVPRMLNISDFSQVMMQGETYYE